ALSVEREDGLEEFGHALFDVMKITRVFTKAPGKDPDMEAPFILERGATVRELAGKIHKDFLETLKYARLWGSSGRFQG
ncbi:MAG: TGS domain-containing protein, partial [Gammaproteobacteria bacterium]|nr:TGS domain-containing protein [Gemmatimonadota bacterium]NIT88330.1 TGS domain-containing protein [Gemmatimonadota bacterium]NIU76064.1 TGS domain-containing protein [Gammaproteobacteria bacterium]NIX40571.1 TGS domain-containing protein [Gemmatimonadota bacterium]